MSEEFDFRKFYDLESYLHDEVGRKFQTSGQLAPLDLFLILHWKSPRAKYKHRDRLKQCAGSFQRATNWIAAKLSQENGRKERLRILMNDWGFRLPTATAILAVLYPDEFTIYDVRVRREVGIEWDFDRPFSDQLWDNFEDYQRRVIEIVPLHISLRDKDRYLWGRSLWTDAQKDIEK